MDKTLTGPDRAIPSRPPDTRPGEASDGDLIAMVADGEVAAFRALYMRYQPRLTRFLFNIVPKAQIIEEVLDDTLMVVWERAGSFKGESKLSTWIFAIAYRKAMKALRKFDEPVEDRNAELRRSPEAGPEEEFARHRVHELLREAMSQLSAEHRAVVDLSYFHNLGYREIAEIMHCPVDTVKTRMFYARRHLRRHLDGNLPDWI